MGTWYKFECPKCRYFAQVSGGRSVGMLAVVRTMTCEDCRALVDVLIGFQGEDGPMGDPEFDKDLNQCPKCRGENITPWIASGPCPRCGARMRRDESEVIMWD